MLESAALDISCHMFLTTTLGDGTVINPVSQRRKLRGESGKVNLCRVTYELASPTQV